MASFARFFFEGNLKQGATVALDEQTAKHIVQVLRKQNGDKVMLCDGKGHIATATITDAAKKRCSVVIDVLDFHKDNKNSFHLAVAFTKNAGRNEWLLEKATELGVRSIIPLSTTRTERESNRYDRWRGILISAMLQSQGNYLPNLTKPLSLKELAEQFNTVSQKLIAHCMEGKEKQPFPVAMKADNETILLIGPEGDFTEEEVNFCEANGFKAVSLGTRRLRTETAAMAACAYFNMINNGE